MRPLSAATLGVALYMVTALGGMGGEPEGRADIVISAAREDDAAVSASVRAALDADPYIYAEHIAVASANGIVRCEGIVADVFELFRVLRLCRKLSPRKRVINQLEIDAPLPDGG